MEEMKKTVQSVVVLAGLLAGAATARAQGSCTFTDENGKTVTWKDCKPPAEDTPQQAPNAPGTPPGTDTKAPPPAGVPRDVSPAKAFPFPGETPSQTPAASATAPGAGAAGADVAPAKKFPFPGESPTPADAGGPPLQDAGSSGESSSSSSSSGSSSGDDGGAETDNDAAAKAAAARHAARGKSLDRKQTPAERENEDLSVAGFYMNDKDYKGAYMRAFDAVSIAADDPDAHLALAEAARKLGKLDEAEKHYKLCLSLDPVPKVRKAAQAALKEMAGG
jgi:hypothetical protein